MGTRTDYFCDLCDRELPWHALIPFDVTEGELRRVDGSKYTGEKHVCSKCGAAIYTEVKNAGEVPASPV